MPPNSKHATLDRNETSCILCLSDLWEGCEVVSNMQRETYVKMTPCYLPHSNADWIANQQL